MGFWTIYAILSVFIKPIRQYISNFYIIESIPNVFVTLGLLGTFTGIAYGLLNFDTTPDHIKSSIKLLLDGLKSAMFTSIVGISLSLIFSKIIKGFISRKYIAEPESPELIELRNLNQNFEELKNAISNKAIGEAFREVITNFNEVLQIFIEDLVQSNFEELTRTINELSNWQREHKEDVQALKTAYKSLVSEHQKFADTTIVWVSKLDEISGQSSKLQKVIDEFNSAFNEDGNLSRILKDVQKAISELKRITENFRDLTTNMNEIGDSIKVTYDKVSEWNESISDLQDSVRVIVEKVETFQGLEINKVNQVLSSIDSLFVKYIEDLENRLNNI
ncbi:MotA/TolQ/ExbB proton channel family protein [Niabella digestorum]|uniref:MotA/TolQ/ExbB proton channel family protein n=1 Tax=Niabella digestorum TaxID=3117701 RepID=UPI003AFFB073